MVLHGFNVLGNVDRTSSLGHNSLAVPQTVAQSHVVTPPVLVKPSLSCAVFFGCVLFRSFSLDLGAADFKNLISEFGAEWRTWYQLSVNGDNYCKPSALQIWCGVCALGNPNIGSLQLAQALTEHPTRSRSNNSISARETLASFSCAKCLKNGHSLDTQENTTNFALTTQSSKKLHRQWQALKKLQCFPSFPCLGLAAFTKNESCLSQETAQMFCKRPSHLKSS